MGKSLYARLKKSQHPLVRAAIRLTRAIQTFTLPSPRLVTVPMRIVYLAIRGVYGFTMRVLICEPIFKAYCTRVGRRVRTGDYIHWIQGQGEIVLGDDVVIDGKCTFIFGAIDTDKPTLVIGNGSMVAHACTFTVARRIVIGRNSMIASGTFLFDSPGHRTDPEERLAGLPPQPEHVRPIKIGDNVWVGKNCTIFPGVTIGDGSIVSAGSSVVGDVLPYTVVAGYPARKIANLRNPSETSAEHPGPAAIGSAPAESQPAIQATT